MLGSVLRRFGHKPKPRPFSEFISFEETLAAAKAAGVSVGDFIERNHLTSSPSALDQTMDGLASFGIFDGAIERVCELGPGSTGTWRGQLRAASLEAMKFMETSREWRDRLIDRHHVTARTCDGRTLSETESSSVDLIHAHKLFPGLPFLTTMHYFREMGRIVRDGGWVVFDIMTENCFSRDYLDAWFDANAWNWDWSPHFVGREYAIGVFKEQNISLIGSFQVPLFPAITECMVLRKMSPGTGVSRP